MSGLDPNIGLCSQCRHTKQIQSDRGSVFHLCTRALNDPAFRKYPPLPVLHCPGYESTEPDPCSSVPSATAG
jgi:hypothetical protein